MAKYPIYMNAYGLLAKILGKIKQAKTPDRFTQDFLATSLGFSGGSAKAFIPLAKRLGLLASDGTPTDLYRRFRNPKESHRAMAEAMRKGYADVFARNEFANALDRKGLEGLIMELTGLEKGHKTVSTICSTFFALAEFADFAAEAPLAEEADQEPTELGEPPPRAPAREPALSLSYQINLVLPRTDDIAVFNAIFKSLRENLLR
jgi:hypothetical protein